MNDHPFTDWPKKARLNFDDMRFANAVMRFTTVSVDSCLQVMKFIKIHGHQRQMNSMV